MDHRKSDLKDLCAEADRAIVRDQRLVEASEQLLDRVREVSQAVDDRIRRALESQQQDPWFGTGAAP